MQRLIIAATAAFCLVAPARADITRTFSEQERLAALALFDLAVKGAGLPAAEAAAVLSKKFAPDPKAEPKVEPKADKPEK